MANSVSIAAFRMHWHFHSTNLIYLTRIFFFFSSFSSIFLAIQILWAIPNWAPVIPSFILPLHLIQNGRLFWMENKKQRKKALKRRQTDGKKFGVFLRWAWNFLLIWPDLEMILAFCIGSFSTTWSSNSLFFNYLPS